MASNGGCNTDFNPIKNEIFSSHAFANINHVINDFLLEGGKFILTFVLEYLIAR